MEPEAAVIAQGPFERLRHMQRVLRAGGLSAEIVSPAGAQANT